MKAVTPRKGSALDGSVGKTRYALLAESLLEKINSGDYPVGKLLPTESELCEQFGVSRTTVREALRHLDDMGLLSRRAGVGTLIRAKHAAPHYVHAIESISDIFQYAKESGRPTLLSAAEVRANKDEARLLRCAPGQAWLKLETTRSFVRENVPMVYVHAYLPPAYAGLVKQIPKRSEPMYTLLESEYGVPVLEVQQEFRAMQIGAPEARILKVKPGSAGLYVVRHYLGGGERLLLVTLSLYPSDRFSYAIRLRYNQQSNKESTP